MVDQKGGHSPCFQTLENLSGGMSMGKDLKMAGTSQPEHEPSQSLVFGESDHDLTASIRKQQSAHPCQKLPTAHVPGHCHDRTLLTENMVYFFSGCIRHHHVVTQKTGVHLATEKNLSKGPGRVGKTFPRDLSGLITGDLQSSLNGLHGHCPSGGQNMPEQPPDHRAESLDPNGRHSGTKGTNGRIHKITHKHLLPDKGSGQCFKFCGQPILLGSKRRCIQLLRNLVGFSVDGLTPGKRKGKLKFIPGLFKDFGPADANPDRQNRYPGL
jgi:hypothetical protein